MSKRNRLTYREFSEYIPPKRTTSYIEKRCSEWAVPPQKINVLEWGCGRGLETLWFREQGYNAYGVDIDSTPLQNGIGLFESLGHPDGSLALLGPDLKTNFPDSFFDLTFSNQVFEHVEDLARVAQELWRVTKTGGCGYHVFPAHKYITEGHLFMPFVHWLPKNRMRKYAIAAYTSLGREPKWSEYDGWSPWRKANEYYKYSVSNTFYRSPSTILNTFATVGFDARMCTVDHPRVQANPILGPLARNPYGRTLVNTLLVTFVSNELEINKFQ